MIELVQAELRAINVQTTANTGIAWIFAGTASLRIEQQVLELLRVAGISVQDALVLIIDLIDLSVLNKHADLIGDGSALPPPRARLNRDDVDFSDQAVVRRKLARL